MAQGFKAKASKPKKSKPTHQKQKKQSQLSKGRKNFAAKNKTNKASLHANTSKQEASVTKEINRKNEAAVAARAVGAGNTFYLKDIKEAGKKEIGKRKDELRKREQKGVSMTDRLKDQLNKLR